MVVAEGDLELQVEQQSSRNGSSAGGKEAAGVRLSRSDWIDAAWKALAHGSIETVKVDRLARQLNVTRGSFYWHFTNKKDLLDAVLDRWLNRLGLHEAIAPHIAELDKPEEKLWAIHEYVVRTINGPQSIFLRLWARKSKRVYDLMKREDDRRIEHYTSLFREAGFADEEAANRAEAYFGLVMSEYLRNGNLPIRKRLELARKQHDLLVGIATIGRD